MAFLASLIFHYHPEWHKVKKKKMPYQLQTCSTRDSNFWSVWCLLGLNLNIHGPATQNGKFRINLFILQLRLSPSLSHTHILSLCPVVIFHKLPLPFQTFFNWNLRLIYGEGRKFHLHSLKFLSLYHQMWLAQFSAQQIFYISGQLWWKTFAETFINLLLFI